MRRPVYHYRVDGYRHRRILERYAVGAVVGIGVCRTDECRHVTARLGRKIFVYMPERGLSAAGALYGGVDPALPAVVCGYREQPVAVGVVHRFEISACGARREQRVIALVDH